MADVHRVFRLERLAIAAAAIGLLLACQAGPNRVAAYGQTATAEPPGKVVEARGNITGYRPKDTSVRVDAATVNLRAVFEDLGPDATLWYQHVQTLANPFFEGRVPESRGQELTAEYLEFYFRLYGLEPAFPAPATEMGGEVEGKAWASYEQPFDFTRRNQTVDIEHARLSVDGDMLIEDEEFTVLGNSGSGEAAGPVSFVGYGIASGPDGYSSFDEETDLSGRIAVLLRYAPVDDDGKPLWDERDYRRQAGIARKMVAVADRGAAAIIMVNPPGVADAPSGLESPRRSSRFGRRPLDIPVMQVTPDAADRILRAADFEGRGLAAWQEQADMGAVTTVDFGSQFEVTAEAEVSRDRNERAIACSNVGGVLRGRGDLADEWIVIGAHSDHVGHGALGGTMQGGKLHPGADDNASGTAGVLVLARQLTERYEASREDDLRSILFMTFDAEEMGLHGSRHFAENPPIEPEQMVLCLNMDMIGRLRGGELWALGTETGEGLGELLRPHFIESGLIVAVSENGSGRSDDANFHRIGVPAVHFFTGMHPEYTSPEDQAYTVNPAGAAQVLNLLNDIAWDVARIPERLEYTEPGPSEGQDRGYANVRLGILPGMGSDEGKGVVIDDVFEGTSAAEGGILAGDVIIMWDDQQIEGLGDLFEHLQGHKPGDRVKIVVMRKGQRHELAVTLKAGGGR